MNKERTTKEEGYLEAGLLLPTGLPTGSACLRHALCFYLCSFIIIQVF
nr:MAG TPA: hypothetical protein [Bacteriophage sp.]